MGWGSGVISLDNDGGGISEKVSLELKPCMMRNHTLTR